MTTDFRSHECSLSKILSIILVEDGCQMVVRLFEVHPQDRGGDCAYQMIHTSKAGESAIVWDPAPSANVRPGRLDGL